MPATMKAVQMRAHGGPEVMQVVDLPLPEPGPGKVRVRIEACGLNYSDLMIRGGTYLDPVRLPYVLGREFCGTIEALGEGVSGYSVGQRVVGSAPGGALAEAIVVQPLTLIPCPEGMSATVGASFLVQGITAWHCLTDCGRLQSGETVLIHAAAGGVGALAVQIAQALGARVLGTTSSAAKCQVVSELGATAINYSQPDWVDRVRELTGGRGADLILESVGGEVFRRSFQEALAVFGRLVVFGCASGEAVSLTNVELLGSNKTVTGYYLGGYFPQHLDRVAEATGKLLGLIGSKDVKPLVGKTFPLSQAADAFEHIASRQSVGKVVVTP